MEKENTPVRIWLIQVYLEEEPEIEPGTLCWEDLFTGAEEGDE